MTQSNSKQVLLIASDLLGESLAKQLISSDPELEICLKADQLSRHPFLIIWSLEEIDMPSSIQLEIRRLQDNWHPSPILLLLPNKIRASTYDLLQFDCPGLLQDPDINTLCEAIKILKNGGRIVRLKDQTDKNLLPKEENTIGFSQWLLISGIQQINSDLKQLDVLLKLETSNILSRAIMQGKERELKTAKRLLMFLWGPIQVSVKSLQVRSSRPKQSLIDRRLSEENYGANFTLKERNGIAVWKVLRDRLAESINSGIENSTGTLLAIEALSENRQHILLESVLIQADLVIERLRNDIKGTNSYRNSWLAVQEEIRQQSLRSLVGNYIQIPNNKDLTLVVERLIEMTDLTNNDDDLPDCEIMLAPLILDQPLPLNGQLIPADDPRALMQLEILISNWMIRTTELITAEILGACAEWPELRRYLLNPKLVSTRELERLRNQLNSQNRWRNLIQRPIQMYESKRLLYNFRAGLIEPILFTEPRDHELLRLGWWQQQVALLVEARDALAPQLQELVKKIGNIMAILLTQVIGRAIGLIGRGIVQGMGRSLKRS